MYILIYDCAENTGDIWGTMVQLSSLKNQEIQK